MSKKKETLIDLKNIEEKDWRGFVALAIIVGCLIVITIAMFLHDTTAIAGLVPIMALVAQWYFESKKQAETQK